MMDDAQFCHALRTVADLHEEIDAIADGRQSEPGAAHVMTTNLHTWVCMAAEELIAEPSAELRVLLSGRVRAGEPIRPGIVADIAALERDGD